MSKNLTRKGLAFGALVALGSTVIAGAPAYAATDGINNGFVSLAPNAGTSYDVLAGSTFDLKSNVVGSLAGTSGKDLKFLVEDSTSKTKFDADVDAQATASLNTLTTTAIARTASTTTATITATHSFAVGDAVLVEGQTGIAAGWYKVQSVSTTVSFTITTAESTAIASGAMDGTVKFADSDDADVRAAIVASDLGSAKLIGSTVTVASTVGGVATTAGRLANGNYVVDTNTNANSVDRVLRLVNTDATATTTVKVTAWVDDNNNGAIDSTEYQSPERTIRFLKNADLTVATTIEAPVIGASGINATVAVTPELNGQQVGNTDVSTNWTLQASTVASKTATYNSTTKVWDIAMDLAGSDAVVAGNYSVQATVAGVAAGNVSSATAAARVAADSEAVVTATADTTYAKNTDGQTPTVVKVRPTKSATVVVTAKDALGAALPAGKAVPVAFSAATTTTDWTINGVKVLDNAATGSAVYTTDASGQITLAVSSTSGAAGDSITVVAAPENVTAAATSGVTLTWETASYSIVDLNNPANGAAQNIVKLGTYTFDLFAGDQWNAPLTGAYRLYITATGRTSAGSNVDFANGKASYTITDAGLGSGSTITVSTELQKNTSGTWAASADAADFADVTLTAVTAPTSAILGAVTYSGSATAIALNTAAITVYNAETTQGAFTDPAGVDYAIITLGAGSGVSAGDVVKVSGAGLFFGYVDATGTVTKRVAADSLEFVLDNAADTIRVYSNKYVKDAVVTIASAGRTGTVKVSSAVAGHASARSALSTLTAPATVVSGATFKVTAKLVDTFGNPVKVIAADASKVTVTYAGPGIVFGTLPSVTDANGELSFSVLTGVTDASTGTVTVAYDLNGDGDTADLNEFTKTASVAVAPAVVVAPEVKTTIVGVTKAIRVRVENAKGEEVEVVVNGRTVAVAIAGTNSKLWVLKATKGKKSVKVYVDGDLAAVKTVTVK
jgi:hypothetical protein